LSTKNREGINRPIDTNAQLIKNTSPDKNGEPLVLEREQEFRKAMSLSYLKTEPAEPKPEKIPKPENIAALREALLSVMKQEQPKVQELEKTKEENPTQNIQQVQQNEDNKIHEKVHAVHPDKRTHIDPHQQRDSVPKLNLHTQTHQKHTKEQVSEEMLKDIFKDE
jgi:hypothetical protein